MAMRQTDSEPPAAESVAESTLAESPAESAAENGGNRTGLAAAVATEQQYVTMLYGLLDKARERSEQELTAVRARGGFGGTHQARLERDVSAAEQERRLAQLNLTERGLCFGRFDDESRQTLYIGRIGLRNDDYELKLIDWRAPAARPFYAATPRNPVGLIRRRHIYTRLRKVTGIDDEVFDLDRLSDSDKATLSGEAALIAAVSAARTGRMADVVATIQAEQDRVVRAELAGVLVVQGGPGTGKTVAALHRAAYLLYTHRRTLDRRGVLVIGPNATFLRYISQVLPSLGETDVVLHTLGDLFPGVHATDDRDPAAVVKGDVRMVRLLQQAVRDRQQAPARDLLVDADRVQIPLRRDAILRARDRARSTRRPHNVARKLFVNELLNELARSEARVLGGPFDDEDLPYARERLWAEPGVHDTIDSLWPLLTPQQLVSDLLRSERAIRSAAGSRFSAEERSVLLRAARPSRWTVADVPLLDEAAELLGVDDSAAKAARRELERAQRLEAKYAQEVLDVTGIADLGMVDAETLAAWNRDNGPALSTAERAAADRSWAYGHVIIDEAQELSAMAWRMVLRRNPSRSMTVVGDVAQTGSPAGARSWKEMLTPLVGTRWREERLTVNYRTPSEIMTVAADVLAAVAPDERPPDSVRTEGVPPRAIQVPPPPSPPAAEPRPARQAPPAREPQPADANRPAGETLPATVARVTQADLAELGSPDGGRVAVIAPDARVAEIAAALPEAVTGDRPESLDAGATLLTVTQAKGLEFDRVVLADPAGIIAQSANGGHDLYVAITRATHRLTVVHEGPLPPELRALTPAG
jgi:DNA helicase IV